MRTIKRGTPDINTGSDLNKYNKYLNQMNFKGIQEDDNIFTIDQESLRDALNVYVDEDDHFVSRPTLQNDNVPDGVIPITYKLVDLKYIASGQLYISQSSDGSLYTVIYYINKNTYKLEGLSDYHISVIDQYIICFNNKGAKVIDTNNITEGWQDFSKFLEIPITKIITGSQEQILETKNDFAPNSYKHQYIWSNESKPLLPKIKEDKVNILSQGVNYKLTIPDNIYGEGGRKDCVTAWLQDYEYTIENLTTFMSYSKGEFRVYGRPTLSDLYTIYQDYVSDLRELGKLNLYTSVTFSTQEQFIDWLTTTNLTNLEIENNTYLKQYTNDARPLSYIFIPTSEVISNVKPGIYIETDYRLLKPLSTTATERSSTKTNISIPLVTIAKGRICIAYDTLMLLSLNNGESFKVVNYPLYDGKFCNIASISDDGQYFFFVAEEGVFRYNIGQDTWADIEVPIKPKDKSEPTTEITYENFTGFNGYDNSCCKFLSGEIYFFIASSTDKTRLYFKGPGLYSGESYTNDKQLTYIEQVNGQELKDLIKLSINQSNDDFTRTNTNIYLTMTDNIPTASLCCVIDDITSHNTNNRKLRAIYIKGGDTYNYTNSHKMYVYSDVFNIEGANSEYFYYVGIQSGEDTTEYLGSEANDDKPGLMGTFTAIAYKDKSVNNRIDRKWCHLKFQIGYAELGTQKVQKLVSKDYNEIPVFESTSNAGTAGNTVFELNNKDGYYYKGYIYSLEYESWIPLPTQINGSDTNIQTHGYFYNNGNYIYLVSKEHIYTNYFSAVDKAYITYLYKTDEKFTKVPQVSYSDTELYLGFNNLLQITKNSKTLDENGYEKLLFNLPNINNQTFIDNITGMINISTTEVALFFKDKITICSKLTDETLGYRYDYYNTKLSTGIRLGDSAINTLEGSYTIFPTKRGLAVMNYQAFMATTDQILEYITDNVKHIWNKFYNDSSIIKIIQWRNLLVLTNNTQQILLYDIKTAKWWKWEVPVTVQIALSDQVSLRLIKDTLLIFKDAVKYYDFSEIGENKAINWLVQSQPLHFNAPNYYKNLKQLVFQFFRDDNQLINNTFLAQIKLYRKRVTVRDPETVAFKIEELLTFVKRFNYWKINELQWGLQNDLETASPRQLKLNGLSIKYEIGEEVK